MPTAACRSTAGRAMAPRAVASAGRALESACSSSLLRPSAHHGCGARVLSPAFPRWVLHLRPQLSLPCLPLALSCLSTAGHDPPLAEPWLALAADPDLPLECRRRHCHRGCVGACNQGPGRAPSPPSSCAGPCGPLMPRWLPLAAGPALP